MLNERQQATFDYLFTVLDASGNGSVEEADFSFSAMLLDREVEDEKKNEIEQAMQRWYLSLKVPADNDDNKVVSKEEWTAWAEGLVAELSATGNIGQKYKDFTDALFAVIALGEASFTKDNYVNWYKSLSLGGDPEANFVQLDANQDGVVTKEEFDAAIIPLIQGEETAVAVWGQEKGILEFLEERINNYAEAILSRNAAGDAMMLGGLKFFFTLRDVLKKAASTREVGACDAINDFLQFKGIVPEGASFITHSSEAVDFSTDAEAVATFVEDKINHYAQTIVEGGYRSDALALGQLEIYMVLRRELNKEASIEDAGMVRAINDVLKFKGLLLPNRHFIK